MKCESCLGRDIKRLYVRNSIVNTKRGMRKDVFGEQVPVKTQQFMPIGYACLCCGKIKFDTEPVKDCWDCRTPAKEKKKRMKAYNKILKRSKR